MDQPWAYITMRTGLLVLLLCWCFCCRGLVEALDCNSSAMERGLVSVVSDCQLSVDLNFSSPDLPPAGGGVHLVFQNVVLGTSGVLAGPAFANVPNDTVFAFEKGCTFFSKIAIKAPPDRLLSNFSLSISDAHFAVHGRVIVDAKIGMTAVMIDVTRVSLETRTEVKETFGGLLKISTYLDQTSASVIDNVHARFSDIVGRTSVSDGKFAALLGVFTWVLRNVSVAAHNISWDVHGQCNEAKLIALNAGEVRGSIAVLVKLVHWTSRTFLIDTSVTTGNAIVAIGSNAVEGPIDIIVRDIVVYIRTEDPSYGAGVSSGDASVVRIDRHEEKSIQLTGVVSLRVANASVTLFTAIRGNFFTIDFAHGPTLELEIEFTGVRVHTVVAGLSKPITMGSVKLFLDRLITGKETVHREATLMSLSATHSCRRAAILITDVTFDAHVFVESGAREAQMELSPWLFTIINILSLSNATDVHLEVLDTNVALHVSSLPSASSELTIIQGILASALQLIVTEPMHNCSIVFRNTAVRIALNMTYSSWQPGMQDVVAPFLDTSASSIGVIGASTTVVLLDVLCCDGPDVSTGLFVVLSNVTTQVSFAQQTSIGVTRSGGGISMSLIGGGSVGRRTRQSGLDIDLIASTLERGFGTSSNRVNAFSNARIVVYQSSLSVDASTSQWIDSIFSDGSDAAPYTGLPPAGSRSSFGGFIQLGGVSFVSTDRPMNHMGALLGINLGAPVLIDGDASSTILLVCESSLKQFRFNVNGPPANVACPTRPPGEPVAALLSLRWTTFVRRDLPLLPTLIALINVSMTSMASGIGPSLLSAAMPLSLLHSDYSNITGSGSGAGAAVLFESLRLLRPQANRNTCDETKLPVQVGWVGLRFGAQTSSLTALRWTLRRCDFFTPFEFSAFHVFPNTTGWMPVETVTAACNTIDGARLLPAQRMNVPRWALREENDGRCPLGDRGGFWTRTATPAVRPAPRRTPAAVLVIAPVTVGATALAVLASGGTAAFGMTSAMRMQSSSAALMIAARCSDDDDDEGGSGSGTEVASAANDNPTQAMIRSLGTATSYAGGAVLANSGLVVAFAVVIPCKLLVLRKWFPRMFDGATGDVYQPPRASPRSIGAFLGTLLPGYGATVFATLLQSTVAACVALLQAKSYEDDDDTSGNSNVAGNVILGLIGAGLIGVFSVWSTYRILDAERRSMLRATTPTSKRAQDGRTRSIAEVAREVFLSTEWTVLPTMGRRQATVFRRRFTVMYASYRGGALRFIALEWTVAALCGVMDALSSLPTVQANVQGCKALSWVVACVCVLFSVAVVRLRPYASLFDNATNGVQALATALVTVLSAASPNSNATTLIALLQMILLALSVVIGMIHEVSQVLGACRPPPAFQRAAVSGLKRAQPHTRAVAPSAGRVHADRMTGAFVVSGAEGNHGLMKAPHKRTEPVEVLAKLVAMVCKQSRANRRDSYRSQHSLPLEL